MSILQDAATAAGGVLGHAVQKSDFQPGGTIPTTKVTGNDLRDFLRGTGWPDGPVSQIGSVEWAAGIVYRESRGDCKAKNHNTNGTWDKGLFQINDVWVKNGTISDEDRLDCTANSLAAQKIVKEQPTAWRSSGSDVPSPAPKGWKIKGDTGKPGVIQQGADAAKDAATGPFAAITKLVAQLFSADTWFRVGKVILGGIVLILSLEIFLNKSGIAKNIPPVIPIP